MNLTKRQREIYDYIQSFLEQHGYAPSLEEIAAEFGLSSVATVHEHIRNLEAKGIIKRDAHRSRALELTPPGSATAVELPLLGQVAAGEPFEAIQSGDTIAIPEHLLGRGETFVLRVRGDSMIDEQVQDGDYLIVERRQTARDGERVVVLIDGENATFKTFYRGPNRTVMLQPANERLEPMELDAGRVEIQGVAIGVLRKY